MIWWPTSSIILSQRMCTCFKSRRRYLWSFSKISTSSVMNSRNWGIVHGAQANTEIPILQYSPQSKITRGEIEGIGGLLNCSLLTNPSILENVYWVTCTASVWWMGAPSCWNKSTRPAKHGSLSMIQQRTYTTAKVTYTSRPTFTQITFAQGAFTFESATYCCQHFSYLLSTTNVGDRMFVTIFVVLDLHSWFVSDMYKTEMTAALSHNFYVNFCFFKFDLNFIVWFILRNRDIFQ